LRQEIDKSHKCRVIRLNKSLTALLKSVRKITLKDGKYVFGGKKPVKDIRGSFEKANGLAGIDPKFRFHDLRHTVASRLVTENHVDLITAAKILGHSTTRMLQRYAHTRKDIEMNAVETLCQVHEISELHKNYTIRKSEESAILVRHL